MSTIEWGRSYAPSKEDGTKYEKMWHCEDCGKLIAWLAEDGTCWMQEEAEIIDTEKEDVELCKKCKEKRNK